MTKFTAFFALLVVQGAAACGGGDPGQGSSSAYSSPTSSDAGNGAADGGSPEAAASFVPSALPDDASLAVDTAPSFQNPAPGDGGCAAPNLVCGGDAGDDAGPACVAVTSDVNNCGACGRACVGPSATCIGGQCACSQLGLLYCSSAAGCIDTTSDGNNCGVCGNVCPQGTSCTGSICE